MVIRWRAERTPATLHRQTGTTAIVASRKAPRTFPHPHLLQILPLTYFSIYLLSAADVAVISREFTNTFLRRIPNPHKEAKNDEKTPPFGPAAIPSGIGPELIAKLIYRSAPYFNLLRPF